MQRQSQWINKILVSKAYLVDTLGSLCIDTGLFMGNLYAPEHEDNKGTNGRLRC